MHCELLGGFNKSQASQAENLDFQWVRDDDPLGCNILNISSQVISSLANYDATPCQMKVIGEYVEEGQGKTHLNDMSGKNLKKKCAEEKGVRQLILMWFIQVSGRSW